MSYSNAPKWTLVNRFTIREDDNKKNDGRPFMRTCVPKRLDIDVEAVEVLRGVDWDEWETRGPGKDGFFNTDAIQMKGKLQNDAIVVFSMDGGTVERIKEIKRIRIRPIAEGMVGGKRRATTAMGFGYSGLSSSEVPEAGLMEGEPGYLSHYASDENDEEWHGKDGFDVELYLDEDKFARLLAATSVNQGLLKWIGLGIVAELFEDETQAFLNEGDMPHVYGLLRMQPTGLSTTRARLSHVHFSTGSLAISKSTVEREDYGLESEEPESLPPIEQSGDKAAKLLGQMLWWQKAIFMALGLLIVILLFRH